MNHNGKGQAMSSLDLAQHFIDELHGVKSSADLHHLLDGATRDLGFQYFALLQHVDIIHLGGNAVWLHTYPEAWVEHFVKLKRFATDPVHVASYRTNVGFLWTDVSKLVRLTDAQKKVLGEARRHGVVDGYTVPAHVPGEWNGSCSFAQRQGIAIRPDILPAAQLIGSFAFQKARELVVRTGATSEFEPVKLTSRQLDCIVQVARGKTDWEISQILGIKEETVSEYLDEARRRYFVARRVQLVTNALYDGHITLSDTLN